MAYNLKITTNKRKAVPHFDSVINLTYVGETEPYNYNEIDSTHILIQLLILIFIILFDYLLVRGFKNINNID